MYSLQSLVRKSSVPKLKTSFRSISDKFGFQPIPDEYLIDPLDETARSALAKSCYVSIDWKISEDATVYEAIQRMAVHKIGALAVVSAADTSSVVGIIR
jgi:hypothetical protein